jgi:hypothetical protein
MLLLLALLLGLERRRWRRRTLPYPHTHTRASDTRALATRRARSRTCACHRRQRSRLGFCKAPAPWHPLLMVLYRHSRRWGHGRCLCRASSQHGVATPAKLGYDMAATVEDAADLVGAPHRCFFCRSVGPSTLTERRAAPRPARVCAGAGRLQAGWRAAACRRGRPHAHPKAASVPARRRCCRVHDPHTACAQWSWWASGPSWRRATR